MTPEETVKIELMNYVNSGEYLKAYVRLMQILDPELSKLANLIAEVRQHGYGQIETHIVGGKITQINQTLGHKVSTG